MAKPTDGNIKGAQEHAEGQHGKKTRERLQELNATGRDAPDPTQPEGTRSPRPRNGGAEEA